MSKGKCSILLVVGLMPSISATFDHSSMVLFSPITAVTTIMAAIGMVIRGYVMTRIEPDSPCG